MISVVIPLYNKVEAIGRAVDSVRAQSRADWELIVVDDGSRDEGPAIVARYADSRIRLVSQPNAGVSAARNRGVELATHRIVAFLDADDFWAPDHLANLNALVERFPDAAFYACAYKVVNEQGETRKIRVRGDGDGEDHVLVDDYFRYIVEVAQPVHSSAVAIPQEIFRKAGGFPVGITSGEDVVMWSRLACLGSLAYSKKASAHYVPPPVSLARRSSAIRRPQKPDRVAAELHQLRGSCRQHARSLHRYLGEWHRIRAMLFLELNERVDCLLELRRALACSPPKLRDAASVALLALPDGWRRAAVARLRAFRGGGIGRTQAG